MKNAFFLLLLFVFYASAVSGQVKNIHVFVALCDNEHQGIVPVPASIGNGKDPRNNLYWGASYGVKTYFQHKSPEWELIKEIKSKSPFVLERLLFKLKEKDVYMLADAYDGEQIKVCTEDFLKAANGQQPLEITSGDLKLSFGGGSDLLAYTGHDGLMDFGVNISYAEAPTR
ncbi:hypothetical protein RCC89_10660 [Cytophagaceae bacterium ABcell3]|nr:hypothetical protein RCC89_10660 [Cytophagaceae bacterium ABcell3]